MRKSAGIECILLIGQYTVCPYAYHFFTACYFCRQTDRRTAECLCQKKHPGYGLMPHRKNFFFASVSTHTVQQEDPSSQIMYRLYIYTSRHRMLVDCVHNATVGRIIVCLRHILCIHVFVYTRHTVQSTVPGCLPCDTVWDARTLRDIFCFP